MGAICRVGLCAHLPFCSGLDGVQSTRYGHVLFADSHLSRTLHALDFPMGQVMFLMLHYLASFTMHRSILNLIQCFLDLLVTL